MQHKLFEDAQQQTDVRLTPMAQNEPDKPTSHNWKLIPDLSENKFN